MHGRVSDVHFLAEGRKYLYDNVYILIIGAEKFVPMWQQFCLFEACIRQFFIHTLQCNLLSYKLISDIMRFFIRHFLCCAFH